MEEDNVIPSEGVCLSAILDFRDEFTPYELSYGVFMGHRGTIYWTISFI